MLYLYAELMPYNIPVLREFVRANASVHVVSWDTKKLTPYAPPAIDGVTYYRRSDYTWQQLASLAESLKPSIVYVSGWQDKGYLYAAHRLRKDTPVVAGFDDQWLGTVRQRVGSMLGPVLLRQFFSHAWVAGPQQYEFARRIGFRSDRIVFDLLSADVATFRTARDHIASESGAFPRGLLYVGRLNYVKGTDILLRAYDLYRRASDDPWPLTCIGGGILEDDIRNHPHIRHYRFTSQREMMPLIADCGVFILPSREEPWGVVVHEFASAGRALMLSEKVGAASRFLIDGFNGLGFEAGSAPDLARAMAQITSMPEEQLFAFSGNSARLAERITPRDSAASFLSVAST